MVDMPISLIPSFLLYCFVGGITPGPANLCSLSAALLPLLRRFKEQYPDKDIWCYTGYVYERDLLDPAGRAHCEVTEELLSYIDILVDGEFDQALYDISLKFRGSSNQRVLQIQKPGCPELFPLEERDKGADGAEESS